MLWTRQPPTFTGFSPRYPRPTFCYLPSVHATNDLARGLTGVSASGEGREPAVRGIAYHSLRQTGGGLQFLSQIAITSETFSVLMVANPASASAEYMGINQRGSAEIGAIYWNATRTEGLSAGKFASFVYNSGYSSTDTDGTPVDGNFHVWGVTRNGAANAPVLWVDGSKPAQTSAAATKTGVTGAQSTKIGGLGNATNIGQTAPVWTALCVTWDSVLPDGLMAELGRNPWQLFRPLASRVYSFPTQSIIPILYHHYAGQRAA